MLRLDVKGEINFNDNSRFDYQSSQPAPVRKISGDIPFFDDEEHRRAKKNEEVLQSIERAKKRREEEEQVCWSNSLIQRHKKCTSIHLTKEHFIVGHLIFHDILTEIQEHRVFPYP